MQIQTLVFRTPRSESGPARPLQRRLGAGALAIVAVAGPATAGAGATTCAAAGEPPVTDAREQTAAAVVCVLNQERVRRKLPALRGQSKLERAAERYARDMVRRRFFSHTSPEGTSIAERLRGVAYIRDGLPWAVGETLAWGTGSLATPAAIVAAWLNSPGHRRVLLGARYREVGIGVAAGVPLDAGGGLPGATYVAELGVGS